MADQFVINDVSLKTAAARLTTASTTMAKPSKSLPGQLASLTGIGSTVNQYLKNLQDGRQALAAAAKTGATQVSGVITESKSADKRIAGSLSVGFVAAGKK